MSDDEDSYDESGGEEEEEEGWSDNGEEENEEGNKVSTPLSARKRGTSSSSNLKRAQQTSSDELQVASTTPRQKRGTLSLNQSLHVASEAKAEITSQTPLDNKPVEEAPPQQEQQKPDQLEAPCEEQPTQIQTQTPTQKEAKDLLATEAADSTPEQKQQEHTEQKAIEQQNSSQAVSFLPAQIPRSSDLQSSNESNESNNSPRNKTPLSIPIPSSEQVAVDPEPARPQTPTGKNSSASRAFLGLARSISTRTIGNATQGNVVQVQPKRASLDRSSSQEITIGLPIRPTSQQKPTDLSVFDQVLEEYYQEIKASLGGIEKKERAVTLFFDIAIESLFNKNEAKRQRAETEKKKIQEEALESKREEPDQPIVTREPSKDVITKLGQEISSLEKELAKGDEKESVVEDIKPSAISPEIKNRIKGSRLMNKSVNLTEALLELISPDSPSLDSPLPTKDLYERPTDETASPSTAVKTPSPGGAGNSESTSNRTTASMTAASASSQATTSNVATVSTTVASASTSSIPEKTKVVSAAATSPSLPAVPSEKPPLVSGASFKRVGHIGTNPDGRLLSFSFDSLLTFSTVVLFV